MCSCGSDVFMREGEPGIFLLPYFGSPPILNYSILCLSSVSTRSRDILGQTFNVRLMQDSNIFCGHGKETRL